MAPTRWSTARKKFPKQHQKKKKLRNSSDCANARMEGAPELIIQMLDKLADNAVGFSVEADEIAIRLAQEQGGYVLSVTNPGPPLPERMRSQLFDSLVSVRANDAGKHLGLGLFIARLVATGHGGSIGAFDVEGGVTFEVRLPKGPERSL